MHRLTAACIAAGALFFVPGAKAATQAFDLQLVNICEGAAMCAPPGIDALYLQDIYAQIDIQVTVLPTIIDNDLTLPRNSSGGIIPTETNTQGQLIGGALFEFTDSFVVSTGFVSFLDIAPNTVYVGFTGDIAGSTLGVAFVDSPTLPFGIVENTSALEGGSDAITRFTTAVLAHEVGHVLGGEHEAATSPSNIMRATINRSTYQDEAFLPDFSTENANIIQASALLAPVTTIPLPAGLPLMLSSLFVLGYCARRRQIRVISGTP